MCKADIWFDTNVNSVGYVGQYYEAKIFIQCNDIPLTYDDDLEKNNLPLGLNWNKMDNCYTIYGNPTTPGEYSFKVSATHTITGMHYEQKFTVEIKGASDDNGNNTSDESLKRFPPSIVGGIDVLDDNLPAGVIGKYYEENSVIIVFRFGNISYDITGLPLGMEADYDVFKFIDSGYTKGEI